MDYNCKAWSILTLHLDKNIPVCSVFLCSLMYVRDFAKRLAFAIGFFGLLAKIVSPLSILAKRCNARFLHWSTGLFLRSIAMDVQSLYFFEYSRIQIKFSSGSQFRFDHGLRFLFFSLHRSLFCVTFLRTAIQPAVGSPALED